jgi:hypothetical protein
VFFALTGLEALAFTFKGIFSIAASRAWLLFMLSFFVLILRKVILRLIMDIKSRRFVGPLIMAAMVSVVFYGCGSPNIRWIDYESAQQVAAGLDALTAADFRYTELAFLGYPVRQYIMLALPSVIGGRNMFALHFGFNFIFALSALAMYTGLSEFFMKYKPHLVKYAAIITLMTLTSPIIADLTRVCEQSLLPSAFTMMAVGCFLMYIRGATPTSVVGLAFSGVTLASMYTPGFASAALLAAVLVRRMVISVRESKSAARGSLDFSLALLTGVTLFYSLKLISNGNAMIGDETTLEFLITAIKQIITENPYGLFRLLTPIVLLFALFTFMGVFGIPDLQLVLWAFVSIAVSLLMKGYSANRIVSIQRGSVAVPILVSLLGYRFFDGVHLHLKNKAVARSASIGFCLFIVCAVSLNIASPRFMPHVWSSAPQKLQTRVVLDSQKMIENSEFYKAAPPVLLYFTEEGYRANPYEHMRYLNPAMLTLSTDNGIIEGEYSIENGVVIYARASAALPDEYAAMSGLETLTWRIDGTDAVIKRLVIPPQ